MTSSARFIILLLALAVVACSSPARPQVRLAPQGAALSSQLAENLPPAPLKIAVASVISPKETFRSYRELIAYIGTRVNRPAELIQRTTYGEINELVRSGQVELAFVCTLAYVEGRRSFGMELLAAPVVRGRAEYYSYLIVPAESTARTLEDLRGTAFAFSDPMSNTGWLAPAYALARAGQSPDTFFRNVTYTYSHDNSIRAVADRLVDGAAVDSLVYDSTVERKPDLKRRLRVISQLGPYATPPVVVNPALAEGRKADLRSIILGMAEDPDGRRILAELDVDRFILVDDAAYDSIREMLDFVEKLGQRR